jgi:hypothetical protein
MSSCLDDSLERRKKIYFQYLSGNAVIFDYATGGPCFGSSDLLIGEPGGRKWGISSVLFLLLLLSLDCFHSSID